MRGAVLWCVVCCLLAGRITARPMTATAGDKLTFNLFAFGQTVVSCHLTTPHNETLEFFPDQPSPNERYELQPINKDLPSCSVAVKDLNEADSGVWELVLRNDAGAQHSDSFNLTVHPNPNEFLESLDVIWSNPIDYPTSTGQKIDISLSKRDNTEDCYILTPNTHEKIEKDIEGVIFHDSSNFVSCRVTIGPINEDLLGDWVLCGKRTDSEEKDRCQLVTISWYRTSNPDLIWEPSTQPRFDHVVNYGSILSPVVLGYADRVSCHIITPNDEDLVITSDSDYPNLKLVTSSTSVCKVDIGPIEADMIGNWTLYGKFRDIFGIHEIRLPMNLFLYDENNPYDQAYNVTIRDPVIRGIDLGSNFNMTILGTGNLDNCLVITPTGETFDQDNIEYEGVSFKSSEKSMTCIVSLGPLTEQLLGSWTVIGKFSDRGRFIELHQTYEIVRAEDLIEVTERNPVKRGVNLGSILNMDVNGTGNVDVCKVVTPSGESYDTETLNLSEVVFVNIERACRVVLGPITEQLLGNWKVIGRFSEGYRITEEHQLFEVLIEDPMNPIEEDRIVFNLTEMQVATEIGSQHRLTIPTHTNMVGQSCHIRTPAGLQYEIMDGFNVPGVEPITQRGVECGVTIHVEEEAIGTWTLIARAQQRTPTELIERRLPFTINVEVSVDAIPKKLTIFEGNDLYVRLSSPTEEYETCKLTGPAGSLSAHVVDPLQVKSCGFIIMDVKSADAGIWEIAYGNRIMYKADVEVSVSVESSDDTDFPSTIDLTRGQSVNMTVGPVTAVYCRLEDLYGETVFEGFGNCRLQIESVTWRHHGAWGMLVTTAGRVVAVQHQLFINVTEAGTKPVVITEVIQEKPVVTVSCSVTTDAEARGCMFRNPHGKLLLAMSSTAEDRYVTSFHSTEGNHACSLRIINPLTTDLGIWGCSIETVEETYYGFLDVLCRFAMQDPEVAAVVQHEPILKAERKIVEEVEGNPVTLSCSVNAAIRYCYFRSSNGSTFAISPGTTSSAMEYVGAGFEAGECGVKFQNIKQGDQGDWSCYVSLINDQKEQSDVIQLQVYDEMKAQQYHSNSNMIVEGVMYRNRALEYCRYVRIDGYGFSSDSETIDSRYNEISDLTRGVCRLSISKPNILEQHPWSVTAGLGPGVEISRTTIGTLQAPGGPEGVWTGGSCNGFQILLFVILSMAFVAVVMGAVLGPEKNREWTFSRASAVRQSLRNSFRKTPLPADTVITVTTANAA